MSIKRRMRSGISALPDHLWIFFLLLEKISYLRKKRLQVLICKVLYCLKLNAPITNRSWLLPVCKINARSNGNFIEQAETLLSELIYSPLSERDVGREQERVSRTKPSSRYGHRTEPHGRYEYRTEPSSRYEYRTEPSSRYEYRTQRPGR